MSLIKQLWLGILAILLLALGGSFVISALSAKTYLETQLHLKNIDNATVLALSMTQMEKDPVTLELLIAAQFDSGHYQRIALVDPDNNLIIERRFNNTVDGGLDSDITPAVPEWFTQLISLKASPGIAQVQDGWQQYGTLIVESHPGFAWQALWDGTLDLLQWFLVAALISSLIGTVILKYISRPLDLVVQQAEAIGERRFITSAEPRTAEFRRLVRAMNSLSANVKILLEKETRQLQSLQRESQQDPLTGLANRAHFLNLLDSQLTREDADNYGILVITRVIGLAALNHQIGRARVDQLLCALAESLQTFSQHFAQGYVGRLNGSDFILLIPGHLNAEKIANDIAQQLAALINHSQHTATLPVAACNYMANESRAALMNKLDGALAQAELKGSRAVVTLQQGSVSRHPNVNEWRDAIVQALAAGQLELASFPVRQADGSIVHFEAPMRLQLDGQLQPAGYFAHWASRSGLMPRIDLAVIGIALRQLKHMQLPLAVNVSAESLCDADFRAQLIELLRDQAEQAKDLWIDFAETCALRHAAEFRAFNASLRALGCKVGLEHVGAEFSHIRELQDLGIDYIKIDSAIVRNIHENSGNQHFLRNLNKIGHSLGCMMIAEGVVHEQEKVMLFTLDIDAITGPGV
ncbi:MAG TPA: EAL domain-containing protein [Cellvibrio sp.]|nr:EAL domain-containing protein [Cellvibrio sp.]